MTTETPAVTEAPAPESEVTPTETPAAEAEAAATEEVVVEKVTEVPEAQPEVATH